TAGKDQKKRTAHRDEGFRSPRAKSFALSQNAEEDKERQRLFLMTLAPTRSELEYGNRTACGLFPSDRAGPLCSMLLSMGSYLIEKKNTP
ncbi:hypothetical protein, partial [Exiguobacterium sp.]|uniref:hypothetical protein n=1 Tax=Exiguobacterium sp. TaxID=44751 RepID=UPI002899A5F2